MKIKRFDETKNAHVVLGKNTNIVHNYYSYWNKNDYVKKVVEKLTTNLNIKIFYDDPWFWVIYLHKPKERLKQ